VDDVSKDRHTRRFQIVGPVAVLIDSVFSPLFFFFFLREQGTRFCPLFGVSQIANEVGWSHFPFLISGVDTDYLLTFYDFYTPHHIQGISFCISPYRDALCFLVIHNLQCTIPLLQCMN